MLTMIHLYDERNRKKKKLVLSLMIILFSILKCVLCSRKKPELIRLKLSYCASLQHYSQGHIYISTEGSCTPTPNNKSLLLLIFLVLPKNERKKTLNTSKSAQSSSFVPRLFFLLFLFCLTSTPFFFFSQSLVICSASLVECSSHNYKHNIVILIYTLTHSN
jgi:hypothetical protein